ncbi:MAG: flavin reductase family protein [Lentisphaerota bacterium]
MEKVQINNNLSIPMPVVLVGTKHDEKINFMTVGWVTRVNSVPPIIGIGINKAHLTNANIRATGKFSINFPDTKLIPKTDYCGIVSGHKKDKSNVFETFYGSLDVPMIKDCPITLECELVNTIELPSNTFFIGEIKGVWSEQSVMNGNKLNFDLSDLLILTMPDNQYRAMTKPIAKAWNGANKELTH